MTEPTLDGLPTELRIHILFKIHDLNSLRSLIFASPIYHQAYCLVRHELLQHLLRTSYDGLVDIGDAIAAVRSQGLYAVHQSNRERIIALLDDRRRSDEIHQVNSIRTTTTNASSRKILPNQPANINETIQLLHLQEKANFLLEDYRRTAICPKWMSPDKWHDEILPLRLTKTEKIRFFRAFYRLQIYGNIFGPIEIPLNANTKPPETENDWTHKRRVRYPRLSPVFSGAEMWSLFFATMAPWEAEELSCVWRHLFNRVGRSVL